jgi:hypothetical protein
MTTKLETHKIEHIQLGLIDTEGNITLEDGKTVDGVDVSELKRLFNSQILNLTTKTDDYTLLSDDVVVLASGTFTLTLPATSNLTGKLYHIKNIGTGIITVDGNNNETIDGGLIAVIENQYESITIVSDGSNWYIL